MYVATETVPIWKNSVESLNEFESDEPFEINDLFITPFSVPHDAIDPVGFTIQADNLKIGVVTDIGTVTSLVVEKLKGSNVLVLESNHDMNLLFYSQYPWMLKQRIKGRLGHLSNVQSGALLNTLFHNYLKYVVLAHLSMINNSPKVAFDEAMKIINRKDTNSTEIHVAPRKTVSTCADSTGLRGKRCSRYGNKLSRFLVLPDSLRICMSSATAAIKPPL